MGADIGYLQIKIRELQDKNEELIKKVEDSLQREKRFNQNISNLIRQAKEKERYSVEELVLNAIEETYKKEFKRIFEKQRDLMSEDIILTAKGFNHSIKSLLTEVALLKKDNNFLLNLVITKLDISSEEFKSWHKHFEKEYPTKRVQQDLNKFKMKLYTNKEEFRKVLGEDVDAKENKK